MNKNGLLLYLIIFSFISGYSQEKESYDLELSNYGMIKKYKIDYHKTDKKIFLVVNKETSFRKFSKKDSLKLVRLIEVKTSESKKEVAKIIENHKEYKSDTLVLKQDDWIIGYLGSICASDFGRLVPGISVQIVPLLVLS